MTHRTAASAWYLSWLCSVSGRPFPHLLDLLYILFDPVYSISNYSLLHPPNRLGWDGSYLITYLSNLVHGEIWKSISLANSSMVFGSLAHGPMVSMRQLLHTNLFYHWINKWIKKKKNRQTPKLCLLYQNGISPLTSSPLSSVSCLSDICVCMEVVATRTAKDRWPQQSQSNISPDWQSQKKEPLFLQVRISNPEKKLIGLLFLCPPSTQPLFSFLMSFKCIYISLVTI